MTLTAEEQWPAAVEALDRALLISEDVDDREVLWNLGNAALQLGDDQAQLHCYSRALADARASGAVTAVVYALQRLCFSYWLAGDLTAVRSAAEEALSLASSIGRPALTAPLSVWLAFLAVVQGSADYEDLAPQLDTAVVSALGIFADPVHDLAGWARGIHAASAGDRTDALHHLSDFRVAALKRMASVDRLDAAVRAEELELARTWANELEVFAAVPAERGQRPMLHTGQRWRARQKTEMTTFNPHSTRMRPLIALSMRRESSWHTASGCGGRNDESRHVHTSVQHSVDSPTRGSHPSPSARPTSCARPAKPPANGTRRPRCN